MIEIILLIIIAVFIFDILWLLALKFYNEHNKTFLFFTLVLFCSYVVCIIGLINMKILVNNYKKYGTKIDRVVISKTDKGIDTTYFYKLNMDNK